MAHSIEAILRLNASGFFLYQSYKNNPEVDTKHYFLKRAKRLYPEYWFAIFVLLIVRFCMHSIPYTHWYSPILELSLLQNVGIPLENAAMNYPCWYLSVLLFGGTAIYILLRKLSARIFYVIAVAIVIGTYVVLITHSLEIEQWGYFGKVFYLPFWRGVADMMIGTIIYQLPKPKKIFGLIFELGSAFGIIILLRIDGKYDYLAVVLIIVLTWSICSRSSVLRKIGNLKVISILNKYQYGMYVNHISVILVFRYLDIISPINFGKILVLFLGIFLLSWIGMFIINKIQRRNPVIKY